MNNSFFVFVTGKGHTEVSVQCTRPDLIGGEGSCGEGVALAAANLALLTPARQDLVDVLLSKGFLLLLCFLFFPHLQ